MLQFVDLLVNLLCDLRVRVTDAYRDNAAEEIQVFVPVYVEHELIFGMTQNQRVFEVVEDRREQMAFVREYDLVFRHMRPVYGKCGLDCDSGDHILRSAAQKGRYVVDNGIEQSRARFPGRPSKVRRDDAPRS